VEQHRGLGHQRLDAPALVSDQLGTSDAVASSRVGAAVDVVTRQPGLLAAMGDGRLDEYRARIVSDELRDAPAEVCAEVVARVADSLGTEPPALLRRRVRRALGAVDADLLQEKATRARAERSLCRWPGDEPGVDTWMGSFPVEQSRSGWAVVDGLARQYVRDGRSAGLEQARADALMDLIHARATGTFVVQVAVPAEQLSALTRPEPAPISRTSKTSSSQETADSISAKGLEDDELVTVVGLGMPGTTQVRRSWLTTLAEGGEPDLDATTQVMAARWEVVACHADTGALLAVRPNQLGHSVELGNSGQLGQAGRAGRAGQLDPSRLSRRSGRVRATASEAYRPPPALIDLVKARDGRCRFPGCTVNARFCDLDHVLPWPIGPTDATNLICLCRRHHRIKQTVRWRVRMDPDATVTWTDPIGRLRTTLPLDFLQRETDVEPPVAASPKPFRTAPRDTPEVRWSAWEEELAHELARAKRHCDRQRADPHPVESPHGRSDVIAELSTGLDVFTLDPTFAATCGGRRRSRIAGTIGDPPF
jgi:hypothetical protein